MRPAGAAPAGEPQQVRATPPRTRTSTAFSGFVAGAIVLILLLVFILENTQSVKISYFGASGHLALGVAPLLAAVGGALLGELDTDLLVFEHLRQGAAQLGGMVKQARSGLRLAGEAFEKPLRDLPGLPRHQAHMRDGRRAAEISEVAGDQRDRATLNHAAEHHDIAADVLIAVAHPSLQASSRTSRPCSSILIARNRSGESVRVRSEGSPEGRA